MLGDQLGRQWRISQAIEPIPNGLTRAQTAQREKTGFRTIYGELETLQAAEVLLFTQKVDKPNRLAFNGTFKFKPSPFLCDQTPGSWRLKTNFRKLLGSS